MDDYEFNGCGYRIFLPPGITQADPLPLILVGSGKSLRLRNCRIVNAASLAGLLPSPQTPDAISAARCVAIRFDRLPLARYKSQGLFSLGRALSWWQRQKMRSLWWSRQTLVKLWHTDCEHPAAAAVLLVLLPTLSS